MWRLQSVQLEGKQQDLSMDPRFSLQTTHQSPERLVCSLGTQVEETPFCSRTFKELRLGNKMLEGPLETLGEPQEEGARAGVL